MRLIHLAGLGRVLPSPVKRQLRQSWDRALCWQQGIGERRLYAAFVTEGDLVFDIGANYGGKTDAFLRLGARVIALEPDPRCVTILTRRFAPEIALGRLTVLPFAVGRADGRLRLRQFSIGGNNASASDAFAATVADRGPSSAPSIEVEVIDGRALFRQYGEPSFIKIDVEGMDAEVLSTISTRPRALSFEFNLSPELLPGTKACLAEVARLGFVEANFTQATDSRLSLGTWVAPDRILAETLRVSGARPLWGDVIVR